MWTAPTSGPIVPGAPLGAPSLLTASLSFVYLPSAPGEDLGSQDPPLGRRLICPESWAPVPVDPRNPQFVRGGTCQGWHPHPTMCPEAPSSAFRITSASVLVLPLLFPSVPGETGRPPRVRNSPGVGFVEHLPRRACQTLCTARPGDKNGEVSLILWGVV